jgi:hypothetical protein
LELAEGKTGVVYLSGKLNPQKCRKIQGKHSFEWLATAYSKLSSMASEFLLRFFGKLFRWQTAGCSPAPVGIGFKTAGLHYKNKPQLLPAFHTL